MEMPGCSLCMGNQAQVKEGATVFSTSTRNFPNRLGKNTNVYLGSRRTRRDLLASSAASRPRQSTMADMGVLTAASDTDLPVPELRPDPRLQDGSRHGPRVKQLAQN